MFTQVHIEFRAVRLDKDDIISSNNLLALCNLIRIQDSDSVILIIGPPYSIQNASL